MVDDSAHCEICYGGTPEEVFRHITALHQELLDELAKLEKQVGLTGELLHGKTEES